MIWTARRSATAKPSRSIRSRRRPKKGLARIDKHASEQAFTAAMSEAVTALNARDYPRSREAFERARAIKPKAPDVTSGLAAVAEGERLAMIAENREKARGFEAHEAWRSAAQHYQAVLHVDATIRFAPGRQSARRGPSRSLVQAHVSHRKPRAALGGQSSR